MIDSVALNRGAEPLPPHNSDAEESVIGSLLIDPEAMEAVADILTADVFYHPRNRDVYAAMERLHSRHQPTDFVMVCDELERSGNFEGIGGVGYLSRILTSVPTSLHVVYYAEVVARTAKQRGLIAAGQRIRMLGYQDTDDWDAMLAQADQVLRAVTGQVAVKGLTHVRPAADAYLESIGTVQDDGRKGVVSSGFIMLDRLLGGLFGGDLLLLAARPSVGKSAAALGIAAHVGIALQMGVVLFSLEMSRLQVAGRLLAALANLDVARLREGKVSGDDYERIADALDQLTDATLWIDDSSSLSLRELEIRARRLHAEHPLALVIVDYLQLVHATGENRVQQVSAISRGLKALAGELGCPVLALSQLSRAIESRPDHKPLLSDLRECLTADATVIDAQTGDLIAIGDLQRGTTILGVQQSSQRVVPAMVADVWPVGERDVWRLTTRTGAEIRATNNHPLLTPTGWKALEEIKVGDVVATARRVPSNAGFTDERLRLLGYMAGNGTCMDLRGVGCCTPDDDVAADIRYIIGRHWPEITIREKPQRHESPFHDLSFARLYENGYGKPHGNPIRNWLEDIGVAGSRDREKTVPACVFTAGKSGAREFLKGYLATDGCVTRKEQRGAVRFDTTSHQLALQVRLLLLRLGVVAIIGRPAMNSKSTQPMYRITVAQSPENLRRLADELSLTPGKKGRLLRQLATELPTDERPGYSIFALPTEVSMLAATHGGWRHQGKTMSRAAARSMADLTGDSQLRAWADSDLLWETVRSIEPDGHEMTYDLRVPATGCFLANGVVVHNSGSLEQDADVVIFLSRDDAYDKDSERKGIVDVIVAKARNGPTGAGELIFVSKSAKFADLERR